MVYDWVYHAQLGGITNGKGKGNIKKNNNVLTFCRG
jgi:hypothetical protein